MHKTRDIAGIPAAERTSQLWLNVDDVLERVAIGRSSLWAQVADESFPAPYMWKGTPLWTQGDVRDWIVERVRGTAQPKVKGTAVTWELVETLLRTKFPAGYTNRQIAHLLDCDMVDVTNLTRLMAKAGVLSSFSPMGNRAGSTKFYTYSQPLKRAT
jgi:predicted DNA-binding transcriptional regulator AlpA